MSDTNATAVEHATAPFWSDDFDMDLLKVFPNAAKIIRNPERVLWTVCNHPTHGRINCPSMWNGIGSLLWTEKPEIARDEHGWFQIEGGLAGDAPLIECTWLEWLRDAWAHNHATLILPIRYGLPAVNYRDFEIILWNLRKLGDIGNVEESRQHALRWIMRCDFILHRALGVHLATETSR